MSHSDTPGESEASKPGQGPEQAEDAPGEQVTKQAGKHHPAFVAAQWKPGQSGNPSGRPKGTVSLTSLLRKYALRKAAEIPWAQQVADGLGIEMGPNATVADVCMAAMVFHAAKGNSTLMREFLDRIDGKLVVPVAVSGGPMGRFSELTDEQLQEIAGMDGAAEQLPPGEQQEGGDA